MKRIILALSLLISFTAPVVVTVSPAAAVDAVPQCATDPALAKTDVCKAVTGGQSGPSPFVTALKEVINVVSFIVGVAAIIGIIVSGLKMVLANGDSNAVAQARGSLIYALVGVVIVILAQSIVVFVLNKL